MRFTFSQIYFLRGSFMQLLNNVSRRRLCHRYWTCGYGRLPWIHGGIRSISHRTYDEQENSSVDLSLPKCEDYVSLGTDSNTERKIKLILMEHALARMSAAEVPTKIRLTDMEDLLQCKTACERVDLFDLLYMREMRRDLLKINRATEASLKWKRDRMLVQNSHELSGHIQYGLDHNCLHIFLEFEWLYTVHNHRLARAAMFGQPFVFDFGYDRFLTTRERVATTTSVQDAYSVNRKSRDPFDIYFTNLSTTNNGYCVSSELDKHLKFVYGNHSMVTATKKSYLEMFPDKECIYLTPHAEESMEYFDHDAVYIIGAFVEMSSSKHLPLTRAKEDGIRALRIPVEKYTRSYLKGRKRNILLSTLMEILLEMKTSCSWTDVMNKALTSPAEIDMAEELRLQHEFKPRDKRFKYILKDYW